MASNEQHAQMLEALERWFRRQTDQSWREKAEACEAGAACLRREAAYHERLAMAIGAVGEQETGTCRTCQFCRPLSPSHVALNARSGMTETHVCTNTTPVFGHGTVAPTFDRCVPLDYSCSLYALASATIDPAARSPRSTSPRRAPDGLL